MDQPLANTDISTETTARHHALLNSQHFQEENLLAYGTGGHEGLRKKVVLGNRRVHVQAQLLRMTGRENQPSKCRVAEYLN
jgi:hypothetical protein